MTFFDLDFRLADHETVGTDEAEPPKQNHKTG